MEDSKKNKYNLQHLKKVIGESKYEIIRKALAGTYVYFPRKKEDFRIGILELHDKGYKPLEIARSVGCGVRWVFRCIEDRKGTKK